jgi:alanine racemase
VRGTWAEIDLGAVEHNVRALRAVVAPAQLCAVVKAEGYGHGAVPVARAALAAGATHLAVALVEEGVELRSAGIDGPVLVLSEPAPDDVAEALAAGLAPTVYTHRGIAAVAEAATRRGGAAPQAVHLKVDTGMHRVGAPPSEIVALAKEVASRPELVLASVWTHLAVADELDDPFTMVQVERFNVAVDALDAVGLRPPFLHAANSAGAVAVAASRFDLVRCGIALYGIDPAPALAGLVDLRPAMRLVSTVSLVKRVAAGEALSYGQRYRLGRSSTIATVPIGYADGVRRSLAEAGGEVLIGGRRRPLAGTVTMDQLLVDVGDDPTVGPGAEVVLLGRQGQEEITANEVASRLGTIGYEVVTAVGPRVPRRYPQRSQEASPA